MTTYLFLGTLKLVIGLLGSPSQYYSIDGIVSGRPRPHSHPGRIFGNWPVPGSDDTEMKAGLA
jgi:hypothetical protein